MKIIACWEKCFPIRSVELNKVCLAGLRKHESFWYPWRKRWHSYFEFRGLRATRLDRGNWLFGTWPAQCWIQLLSFLIFFMQHWILKSSGLCGTLLIIQVLIYWNRQRPPRMYSTTLLLREHCQDHSIIYWMESVCSTPASYRWAKKSALPISFITVTFPISIMLSIVFGLASGNAFLTYKEEQKSPFCVSNHQYANEASFIKENKNIKLTFI